MPFVRTSATEVFNALDKDPKVDYPIEERMAIQESLLLAFAAQFAQAHAASNIWISDRTPIDLASYLIADVQRGTFDGKAYQLPDMVNDYVRRCILTTNKWFATVVLVQPGIKTVEAIGKAQACSAYMEHLNLVQIGLMMDEGLTARHYMIPRRYTGLEDRVEAVKHAMLHGYRRESAEQQSHLEAGASLH